MHPFANPAFEPNEQVRATIRRHNAAVPHTLRHLRKPVPKMVNRYLPHQGKREIERRRRQRERLEAKRTGAKAAFYEAVDAMVAEETVLSLKERAAQNMGVDGSSFFEQKIDTKFIPERRLATDNIPAGSRPVETKVGKRVTWNSSNADKTGEITHVVPAGKLPSDVGAKVKDAGTPRDYESYVVFASTANGKNAYYWPRVSLLTYL